VCLSRLHQVVDVAGDEATVRALDGVSHRASLLAYEGPFPRPGDWLVVHSGFALARAGEAEVEAALAELSILTGEPPTSAGSTLSRRGEAS
jgi:hydrogenase maturation factor